MANKKSEFRMSRKSRTPATVQLSAVLRACADQTRLRLLSLLALEGEVCVRHLVEILGTNQPKVSRHLACLKRAGLVSDRRDGLWIYYRLADSLNGQTGRLMECLTSCLAELPELQREAEELRAIQHSREIVRFRGRGREVIQPAGTPVSAPLVSVSDASPSFYPVSELEVELL